MNLEQTHVWSESPVYLCVRSVRDVGGGGFILGNRGCCRVHVGLVDGSNASERIERNTRMIIEKIYSRVRSAKPYVKCDC